MSIYDDDQCANCGGLRVPKSTLCADCLVALCISSVKKNTDIVNKISQLEEKNKKLIALNERLLDHITQQAAYGDELQQLRYLEWLQEEEVK